MKRMQVRHILGAVGVLTLLASSAGVARAGGGGGGSGSNANASAFAVSGAGIGLIFRFAASTTPNSLPTTFTNMAKNNQTFDVATWLSSGGKGYYEIGFDHNAPPAYLMIKQAGTGFGNFGDIIKVNKIGAVYLYSTTQGALSGSQPVLNGVNSKGISVGDVKLYNDDGTNVTSLLPPWVPCGPDSTKSYFGYEDDTWSTKGGLFDAGAPADPLTSSPRYGIFDFTGLSVSGNAPVYIGMDIQATLKDGSTTTGRVYVNGWSSLIPEPAFYQMAALLGLGAGGFALRFRSRRAAA